MKIIKRLFLLLLGLLLLAGGGLFIFLKTFDINQYKPQIISAAQSALGRTIDFKDITLQASLQDGIHAVIHDLRVGEDPAFRTGDFASVQKISLGVDILAYLSRKEISLTTIEIHAPAITIIRGKDGHINAQNIGAASSKPAETASAPTAVLPLVFVRRLIISDGAMTYIDRLQAPEFQAKIDDIDIDINGFSLTDPFTVAMTMATFASEQNIEAKGTVTLNLPKKSATVRAVEGALDISKINWKQVQQLPGAAHMPVPSAAKGMLRIGLKELSAGSAGIGNAVMDITLEKGQVTLRDIAPGITLAIPALDASVTDFSPNGTPFRFRVNAAYLSQQPNIFLEGTGAINLENPEQRFSDILLKTDLSTFALDALRTDIAALKNSPLPDRMAGKLETAVKELTLGANGQLKSYQAEISLSGGAFSLKEITPGVTLDLAGVEATVKNISPSTWAAYRMKAAVLNGSDQPNIFTEGTVFFNPVDHALTVRESTITTDLSTLSLERLKASVAALKDTTLPEILRGKVTATIQEARAGGPAPASFSINATLDEGYVKTAPLLVPAENITSRLRVTQSDLTVDSLSLNLGKGTIKASGIVKDYLGRKPFTAIIQTGGLEIAEIVNQAQWPIKASGAINAGIALAGEGFDAEALKKILRGQGTIEIAGGKLTDFNALKLVMDKISIVPNFGQIIETRLPARWQQKLQQKDTLLTKVSLQTALQNGIMTIKPVVISAEGFDFEGNGTMSLLDQSYAMNGVFIMPQDMATEMAAVVPEMGYIMDANKQIRFPLHVEGRGSQVSFAPDLGNVAATIIQNKGKEEILKLLDKKLGVKLPPQSAAGTSTPSPQEPASPEQQLQQNLLEGVGKFLQ